MISCAPHSEIPGSATDSKKSHLPHLSISGRYGLILLDLIDQYNHVLQGYVGSV